MYVEKAYTVVLLIAIRLSEGDVKPGGPLGAFREEQAMSRYRVSPSPFLSSSSHTTQLHYTNSYTYSHSNLNFLQHCTDTLHTRNVVCPSGACFENRPHLTTFIRLAWNPKRVIVQWVGIKTDRHTALFYCLYYLVCRPILNFLDPNGCRETRVNSLFQPNSCCNLQDYELLYGNNI